MLTHDNCSLSELIFSIQTILVKVWSTIWSKVENIMKVWQQWAHFLAFIGNIMIMRSFGFDSNFDSIKKRSLLMMMNLGINSQNFSAQMLPFSDRSVSVKISTPFCTCDNLLSTGVDAYSHLLRSWISHLSQWSLMISSYQCQSPYLKALSIEMNQERRFSKGIADRSEQLLSSPEKKRALNVSQDWKNRAKRFRTLSNFQLPIKDCTKEQCENWHSLSLMICSSDAFMIQCIESDLISSHSRKLFLTHESREYFSG